MSQNYTPTEWIDNRTVGTASVMNNMEKGIENAHNRIDGVDSQIKDIASKKIYQFESVENMKSYNLKDGDVCETLGYYSNNDGGGGKYLIVNDNSLLDDGGSIHDLYNGLKAKLIIDSIINVKQFGAKGNGVDDDTNKIQLALNFGNVFIPDGNYIVKNSIRILSNRLIEGTGTLIRKFSSTSGLLLINNEENITIKGIKIKQDANYDINSGRCIAIETGKNVLIENVGIYSNVEGWCVLLRNAENITISKVNINSKSDNNVGADGIHLKSAKHIIISDCDITSYDDCIALSIENVDYSNIIEDVVIANCNLNGKCRGILLLNKNNEDYYIRKVNINNCNIKTLTQPILINDETSRHMIDNICINNITTDMSDSTEDRYCIEINYAKRLTISNINNIKPRASFRLNNCIDINGSNINVNEITQSGQPCFSLSLCANIILSNCKAYKATMHGYNIYKCRNLHMSNSIADSSQSSALVLNSSFSCIIDNFIGCNATGTSGNVYETGGSNRNILNNIIMHNNPYNGVSIEGTESIKTNIITFNS